VVSVGRLSIPAWDSGTLGLAAAEGDVLARGLVEDEMDPFDADLSDLLDCCLGTER